MSPFLIRITYIRDGVHSTVRTPVIADLRIGISIMIYGSAGPLDKIHDPDAMIADGKFGISDLKCIISRPPGLDIVITLYGHVIRPDGRVPICLAFHHIPGMSGKTTCFGPSAG
ncbi:hypothetical protein ACFL03_14810 [Thermodesulfobacteriota bacterium]